MEQHDRKKPNTLRRRLRRWKRRLLKRHAWAGLALSVAEGLLGFLAVALIAFAVWRLTRGTPEAVLQQRRQAQLPAAEPADTPMPSGGWPDTAPPESEAPAPEVSETPSETDAGEAPEAGAEALSSRWSRTAAAGAAYSDPASNQLLATRIYAGGTAVNSYQRPRPIQMGSSGDYASLEGVTTFRGSHYRDGGACGTIPEDPTGMSIVWYRNTGRLDSWSGVGWTGQAAAVRWPAESRAMMNINAAKKAKDGLVEVIYATLDGHIYFLDLDDGQDTRNAIDIGAPIKGSVTVDPRGWPLLYCGQGIYDVNGRRVKCGTRIWSLIDQSLLYMIDGDDNLALRPWRAFDCAPLVDGASDTLFTAGENGVLYSVRLNTAFSGGNVTVDPAVDRYVYRQSVDAKIGTENSIAIYNHYAYFANNAGIIQCVDLNTLQLVWSFYAVDDIDASLVLEVEDDDTVALYAVNEVDLRGSEARCQMFKLNALTGELLWRRDSDIIMQYDDNGGGGFATPAVGRNELSGLVFYHIARVKDQGGMLYALDKRTGETVWSYVMGAYGWSSPTCVYTPSGKGYIVLGSSNGILRLFDGLTGRVVNAVDLQSNIEATPVVFGDMIVVGTRGMKIVGIRIQ